MTICCLRNNHNDQSSDTVWAVRVGPSSSKRQKLEAESGVDPRKQTPTGPQQAPETPPSAPAKTVPVEVLKSIRHQFAPVLSDIKAAQDDPTLWKEVASKPEFSELFSRVKYHVLASQIRGQRDTHREVVEGLAAMTGLIRSDLDELATVDPVLIREGRWMPKTARIQRLAMDAHEIDFENPDAIVRLLNHVSGHLPKVKSLKMRHVRAVADGLDKVYAGADFVFDRGLSTGLNHIADWLDSYGKSTTTEVRRQYSELGDAARAIGASTRKLKGLSESDQKMALLCASAMSDVSSDIGVWFELLQDPKKLEDKGFVAKLRNIARVGVDGAVLLIGGAADALHSVFDRENLRDFNVNLLLGAGLEVMFCGGSFGIGLYLPSVNEMKTSENAAAHVDFALGVVAPFGSLMASSRGGKKQIRLPFLKVRNGEFSQAIGVGTGLVGGVNFLRDKTYGAGMEAGWFPKLFPSWVPEVVTRIFNVRAGGNVVVHHPAMRVQDRAVAAAVDTVQRPLDALANSLVRGSPASTSISELRTKRLQNSAIKLRQAKRAFSAVQSYRLAIDTARQQNRPFIPPGTEAYEKCTRGCSAGEAEEIIQNFLRDLSKDCEQKLGEFEALLTKPPSETAKEERAIRRSVREYDKVLKDIGDRFNMADVLLQQVFGAPGTKAQGEVLSKELLASIKTGGPAHWALTTSGELFVSPAEASASPSASLLSGGAPTRGAGTFRLVRGEDGGITSAIVNTTATEAQAQTLADVRSALIAAGVPEEAILTATGTRGQEHKGDLADALSPAPASGRRTRIIATLDPTTGIAKIERLIKAGMNIARINLSHEAVDQHLALIKNVKTAAERAGVEVPIIVDLPGPKIRLGKFDNPSGLEKNDIVLVAGRKVALSRDCLLGSNKQIPFEYEGLVEDVKVGHRVHLNDGKVELRVESIDKEKGDVQCEVVRGGVIWDNAGMNLPDTEISLPTISNEDFERLRPLVPHVDQISVSFAREARDITDLRQAVAAEMTAKGLRKKHLIVAKIESTAGVKNLEPIARAADVIMTARGDLQAEIGFDKVPEVQARIQKLGKSLSKPVIVATGVMSSMVNNGNAPSQGEADGLNSVARFQEAEAILLSRETRSSVFSVETVEACAKILEAGEAQRKRENAGSTAV